MSRLVVDGLRREIEAHGFTQAGLCRVMGISQKHLSQIITGKVPLSTQIAVRMEVVLEGVDAEQLMALQAIEEVRDMRLRYDYAEWSASEKAAKQRSA